MKQEHTVLVTGANSGLGFEAARQLAALDYERIILACRTEAKAQDAADKLKVLTGRDVFSTLAIDVSNVASTNAAVDHLIADGRQIHQLLLNAGVVPGDRPEITADGIETTFAASLIGHHILSTRLIEADLLADDGRIVLVSSEGARGDLPAAMGISLADFAKGAPSEYGSTLDEAMANFARGTGATKFDSMRHYATVKLFSTWWTAELAEQLKGRASVIAVSPGASLGTNIARDVGGLQGFLFKNVMPLFGKLIGVDQPVGVAAKRYVDVLKAPSGTFKSGRAYMSAPRKMVGPLVEQTQDHLYDAERRKVAWSLIDELAAPAMG